jgi:uroporphyrinogen decarboxylase
METSKEHILKAVEHNQPETAPINIEGIYADLQPWYDYFDIGMDVWETVQAHLPGNEPDVLKREYGSHITFFGGISTQTTLPFGPTDDVRREVRERIRVLGKTGGYICGPDHGIMPDVPMENVLAMYDEARKFKF